MYGIIVAFTRWFYRKGSLPSVSKWENSPATSRLSSTDRKLCQGSRVVHQNQCQYVSFTMQHHAAHSPSCPYYGIICNYTDKKAPFFLYMAFQHTHHPQFAGKTFTNSSVRGKFGDSLNEMDWAVGQIFQFIEDAGVKDNTFVFFTSDNGWAVVKLLREAVPPSI